MLPVEDLSCWPSGMLRVDNLSAGVRDTTILSDITFELPSGGITAIIGPSGCGKSTLLKTLVHLIDGSNFWYRGAVTYGALDLLNAPQHQHSFLRRHIAYINQFPGAFPGSVLDNVLLPLKYWMPGARDAQARAEEALRSVKLWKEVSMRLNMDARALSSGQLQRLSIARALVINSPILLLDEPTAFIDPTNTMFFEELIWGLKGDRDILIVTHNMQQAARVSDKAMFMMLGRLVEFGDTNAIFMNPSEKLTEDYVSGRFG